MKFPSLGLLQSAFNEFNFKTYIQTCEYELDEYLNALEKLNLTLFDSQSEVLSMECRVHRRRILQMRIWLGMFDIYEDISPHQLGQRCQRQIDVYLMSLKECVKTYVTCNYCEFSLRVLESAIKQLEFLKSTTDTSFSTYS